MTQDPTQLSTLFMRGFALHQQGQLTEANSAYQQVIGIDRSHFDATHMSGVIALQTGNHSSAFELLKTAAQLQPNNDAVHINLALLFQTHGQADLALQCINRAITLNPSNPIAWNNRGNLLQDANHLNEALSSFNKAIDQFPQYIDAHNNRGNLLLKMKRHDEACNSFKTALELDPRLTSAHYGLGLALQDAKQPEQALACFEQVITLAPDHADAHFHIGLLHHERRDFKLALSAYDKAISLKPDIDYLLGYRLYAKNALCDWSNRETDIQQLVDGINSGKKIAPPFFYLSLLDSPELHLKAAEIIAAELPHPPQNKPGALSPMA